MPVIRDIDAGYLKSIKTALWEIRHNVQRGGRAGVLDIDDWAKLSLEMIERVLEEMR